MALVPAKCPECGGNINIDPAKKAGICEYCKQPFIVEEAINNFNTTYNVTNNNEIKADVVNVYENKEKDFIIKAGILEQYVGESVNIVIPDSVVKIDINAFKGCSEIRSIKFGSKIKEIGNISENLFKNAIYVNESVLSQDNSIAKKMFCDCEMLEKVELPEGVEIIGDRVFSQCYQLKEINFPSTIKKIGKGAFERAGLKEVKIKSSSIHIEERAFACCPDLEEVKIDCANTVIDAFAFGWCQNLKVLRIPRAKEIGDNFIVDCTSLTQIELPNKVDKLKEHITSGLNANVVEWIRETGAETNYVDDEGRLIIPDGATSIEYVGKTNQIKKIIVPGSVGSILERSFIRFVNLEEIVLLNGIKHIATGAFYGCNKLKKITIPSSVIHIDDCFRYIGSWADMKGENTSLEEIEISEDVLRKHIAKFCEGIINTPYMKKLNHISNFCPLCGTSYGIFSKKCSECGHKRGEPLDILAAREYRYRKRNK